MSDARREIIRRDQSTGRAGITGYVGMAAHDVFFRDAIISRHACISTRNVLVPGTR